VGYRRSALVLDGATPPTFARVSAEVIDLAPLRPDLQHVVQESPA